MITEKNIFFHQPQIIFKFFQHCYLFGFSTQMCFSHLFEVFHPSCRKITARSKLSKTCLRSPISPLHCSFYKSVVVGKRITGKEKLFWHTKVIVGSISSTALVKNVTSYLTVKSPPLLSPLEPFLPAACQLDLFRFAGCNFFPESFFFFVIRSSTSTHPITYSFIQ